MLLIVELFLLSKVTYTVFASAITLQIDGSHITTRYRPTGRIYV